MAGEFDSEPFSFDETPGEAATDAAQEGGVKPRHRAGLVLFGLILFIFFLVMKLPETRIQNFVMAHIRIAAQNAGYSFSAGRIRLGLFLGPSLKMDNVELKSLEDDRKVIKLTYLKVSPHLLSLMPWSSVKKGSITAELPAGEVSGVLGAGPSAYVVDLDVSKLALEKLLPLAGELPLQVASAQLDGNVDLRIDLADMRKTEGSLDLKLTKFQLPGQSVYGFTLPKIAIAETRLDATVAEGKVTLRAFNVGKDVKGDDLVAQLSGDATIDGAKNVYNPLDRVKLNLKATFELSAGLKGALPFIDALLGPAKGTDGKYGYKLGGTLAMPIPTPGR